MRNKKVLFVSEASWMSTGYSVYTKEVLSRLNQIDGLEVAELACYADALDENGKKTPWKCYPNKPLKSDPAYDSYSQNPSAQFGDQAFNHVLLDFKPDIVMDIRDWWMLEFEQRSPFRDFFHWAIMPTVDASPQNQQWINTYNSADSVFTYSEFGRDTLLSQCDSIKFTDIASPAASQSFSPVENKQQHKESMGVSSDSIIIGTVMRNQKRKLYPDLLQSFRKILSASNNPNLYLYLHTYYPDVGWEIPSLIQDSGLANRVLMTYRCKACGHISVNFFQNSVCICDKCKSFSNSLVGINNSISEQDLSKIYNLFDVYVQYANSEGFGMPQLEAAQCGLPVISTYYSAMQSVIDNIGGYGIKPLAFSKECETGCDRAIPDNDVFVALMLKMLESYESDKDFFAKEGERIRKNAISNYTWDKAADAWAKRIKQIELKDLSETWLSPPNIKQPNTNGVPSNLTNPVDVVNYLFDYVLCKPEWKNEYLWRRLVRDITFAYRCENISKDFYFNESHVKTFNSVIPFSPQQAYEEMLNFRNQINQWEGLRVQMMQTGSNNE
tara:strand:- start:3705 stop:5369 length:1665 start_codon:yes stop_codon:yes gene_type:complete